MVNDNNTNTRKAVDSGFANSALYKKLRDSLPVPFRPRLDRAFSYVALNSRPATEPAPKLEEARAIYTELQSKLPSQIFRLASRPQIPMVLLPVELLSHEACAVLAGGHDLVYVLHTAQLNSGDMPLMFLSKSFTDLVLPEPFVSDAQMLDMTEHEKTLTVIEDASKAEHHPVRSTLKAIAKAEAILSGVDPSKQMRLTALLKALDMCGVYDPETNERDCMDANAPTLAGEVLRIRLAPHNTELCINLGPICAENSNSIQGLLQAVFDVGFDLGSCNK